MLYAGIRAHNATAPLIIEGLRANPDEVLCMDVLTTSLTNLRNALSSCSVAVVDQNIMKGRKRPGGEKFFYRYTENISGLDFSNIVDVILTSTPNLALLAVDYDIHAPLGGDLTDSEIERFEILIWQYVDPPLARDEVKGSQYLDAWMYLYPDPMHNWTRITNRIPLQIEYTHVLASSEFIKQAGYRMWDACVPGAQYATREIAQKSAKKLRLSCAPIHTVDKPIRVISKIGAHGPVSDSFQDWRFRMRNLNFRGHVRHSKSAFVCGSGYEHVVRKYFEIPALGTPMLAYPLEQISRMGFIDGVHYLSTMPEEYGINAQRIIKDSALARKLIDSSTEMLQTLHTQQFRTKGLIAALTDINEGRARGARFENGVLRSDKK